MRENTSRRPNESEPEEGSGGRSNRRQGDGRLACSSTTRCSNKSKTNQSELASSQVNYCSIGNGVMNLDDSQRLKGDFVRKHDNSQGRMGDVSIAKDHDMLARFREHYW